MALLVVLLVTPAMAGCIGQIQQQIGRIQTDRSGPGSMARDFITNHTYTKLEIEIQYVNGSGPTNEAVSVLKQTALQVLAKNQVTVVLQAGIPGKGANHAYTWSEVNDLEQTYRKDYSHGSTAVLYYLYLDGKSSSDNGNALVLGAAYHGSSIVMFKGNLRASSSGSGGIVSTAPQEHYVERAVIVHEFGHELGLVNCGIPMQTPHEDPNHKCHSNDKNSVMYWAVESSNVANIFSGGSSIPYQFDSYDKQDIAAVRTG